MSSGETATGKDGNSNPAKNPPRPDKPPGKYAWWTGLAETPTGRVVNATRILMVVGGIVAIAIAMVSVACLLIWGNDLVNDNLYRIYAPPLLFVAGLLLVWVAKLFSLASMGFLLPDILKAGEEAGKTTAELKDLIETLERHTGAAAFFNRIGFSGLSLGTIASAFLVLLLGMAGRWLAVLSNDQVVVFFDLAKLLFGAFIGSFASRVGQLQEGDKPMVKTPPPPSGGPNPVG